MSHRLPSKRQLQSMFSDNAWTILDVHAKKCREIIEDDDVFYTSKGRPISVNQGRARERRKLNRIYALAHELGHYVGQPDYCTLAMETLKFRAEQKALWRKSKADRYPQDPRNHFAAEKLQKLSTSVPTDYDLARRFCDRYYDNSMKADLRLSDHLTDVGFRTHPANVDDLLQYMVKNSPRTTRVLTFSRQAS